MKRIGFNQIVIALLILFCIGWIFIQLDANLSKEQYVEQGILLSQNEVGYTGKSQMRVYSQFIFELDNGERVLLSKEVWPQAKSYQQGSRVKIYYRLGYFTKRKIYEDCEFI